MARNIDVDQLAKAIRNGETGALSRGLTLVESRLPSDTRLARKLVHKLLPYAGNSLRFGITGSPGVGKSTFIESLGMIISEQGKKLAVLSIDPSSPATGGSILGDKTRMEELSRRNDVFIRPSPSGRDGGGVSENTHDQITLCEAAGYDVVFIETVGVGQAETSVSYLVDYLLLLLMAGSGDELQGIKRGIMEVAHAYAFTKSDATPPQIMKRSEADLRNAVHIFRQDDPKIFRCSPVTGEGIEEIWDAVQRFATERKTEGQWDRNRERQDLDYFEMLVNRMLVRSILGSEKVQPSLERYRKDLAKRNTSPLLAAEQLIDEILKANN